MTLSDLLTPWLLLGGVLFLLVQAEKWIHSHLYGVGWLLTEDKQSATALYYLILFPGVFMHEVTQWLLAGAINVPTRRFMAWPEAQEDGTLRLDFVQIQKAGWFASALIGAIPFITGTALIWLISNQILNLERFFDSLSSGDLTVIGPALQQVGSTPDFYLWLYVLFAITNAMLPTPADRKGWPLLIGLFAVCLGFLVLIGVGPRLYETFTGPVAHGLNLLTAAFSTVLVLEVLAIVVIGMGEQIVQRLTRRSFTYVKPVPPVPAREPGSSLPLPPGVPPPSIYRLELPLPDPSAPAAPAPQPGPQPATATARPDLAPRPTQAPATSGSLPAQPGVRPAAASLPGSGPQQPGGPEPSRQPAPGARPLPRPAMSSAPAGPSDTGGNRPGAPSAFPRPANPGVPAPARPLPGTPADRPQNPQRSIPGAAGSSSAPDRGAPAPRQPFGPSRPPAGGSSQSPRPSPSGAPSGAAPAERPGGSPFSVPGSRPPTSGDPNTLRPQPPRPAPSGGRPFPPPQPGAFSRDTPQSKLGLGEDADFDDEGEDLDDLDDLDDDGDLEYVDFDDL
ncbi:hypothetical protein [Aggregatilinea lenta]|uniref:hypothetical protein n=1 Tax=Aggregatilinea lenta TaxID=913108 RepID=UPI000E5C002F|nr:hypothetical protein [Aggregatilinea lenta]